MNKLIVKAAHNQVKNIEGICCQRKEALSIAKEMTEHNLHTEAHFFLLAHFIGATDPLYIAYEGWEQCKYIGLNTSHLLASIREFLHCFVEDVYGEEEWKRVYDCL